MVPASGDSSPAMIFSSVVLPAPFGPIKPTRSPSPIVRDTFSNSIRTPNVLPADWQLIRDIVEARPAAETDSARCAKLNVTSLPKQDLHLPFDTAAVISCA